MLPNLIEDGVLTGYAPGTHGVLTGCSWGTHGCVRACVCAWARARSLGSTRAAVDCGLILCAHVQQHRRLAGSARTRRCNLGLACTALQLQHLVLPFKPSSFEPCAMADPFLIDMCRAHIERARH